MWLHLLVLFAALSPGILFTIPSLGKNMGGKAVIAAMHALLFVIVANLLVVVEGFQFGGFNMPSFSLPGLGNPFAQQQKMMLDQQKAMFEQPKVPMGVQPKVPMLEQPKLPGIGLANPYSTPKVPMFEQPKVSGIGLANPYSTPKVFVEEEIIQKRPVSAPVPTTGGYQMEKQPELIKGAIVNSKISGSSINMNPSESITNTKSNSGSSFGPIMDFKEKIRVDNVQGDGGRQAQPMEKGKAEAIAAANKAAAAKAEAEKAREMAIAAQQRAQKEQEIAKQKMMQQQEAQRQQEIAKQKMMQQQEAQRQQEMIKQKMMEMQRRNPACNLPPIFRPKGIVC